MIEALNKQASVDFFTVPIIPDTLVVVLKQLRCRVFHTADLDMQVQDKCGLRKICCDQLQTSVQLALMTLMVSTFAMMHEEA